jgi:hypothetical protein
MRILDSGCCGFVSSEMRLAKKKSAMLPLTSASGLPTAQPMRGLGSHFEAQRCAVGARIFGLILMGIEGDERDE